MYRFYIHAVRRMVARQTTGVRVGGGADTRMGRARFDVLLQPLTVLGRGAGTLRFNRWRIGTVRRGVGLILIWGFLLGESFLFAELCSPILEPYLESIMFITILLDRCTKRVINDQLLNSISDNGDRHATLSLYTCYLFFIVSRLRRCSQNNSNKYLFIYFLMAVFQALFVYVARVIITC